jgi:hypothetical protein
MILPRFSVRALLAHCTVVAVLLFCGRFAIQTIYPFYKESFTTYVLDGPTSPNGDHVVIEVHDNFPSLSQSFRADVCIRDRLGREKRWFDHHGQHSAQGVRDMIGSMYWDESNSLVLYPLIYGERQMVVVDIP